MLNIRSMIMTGGCVYTYRCLVCILSARLSCIVDSHTENVIVLVLILHLISQYDGPIPSVIIKLLNVTARNYIRAFIAVFV